MFALNLPQYAIKVTKRNDRDYIFDDLRNKYVALTPEEWVRQHFVHFLTEHKGYPTGLIANEIQVHLNGTSKRCDSVVYDHNMHPRVIIEYKAPHVEITQKVFVCYFHIYFLLNNCFIPRKYIFSYTQSSARYDL